MNAHISKGSSKGKWQASGLLSFALSLFLVVGIYSAVQFFGPLQARAVVSIAPSSQIDNQLPNQNSSTHFIQSFYSTGTTSQNVEFIGVYWPIGNPSDNHTILGIGHRDAGTPAASKKEITLEIPYASSSTIPGASYQYEIRDTTGAVYYQSSFTRPVGTAPVSVSTVDVTADVSADGQTVTFNITGTSSDTDVDFVLTYRSTVNSFFGDRIENFGTRAAGATAPQALTYTLGNPGQVLLDSQGFLVDSGTVTFELTDYDTGKLYVAGMFKSNPAFAGSGSANSGPTVTPVVPPTPPKNTLIDDAPDLSGGLVPCDGRSNVNRCTWDKVIELINRVLTWLLFMTVPIAAGMFAYAGFLFLTKGSSEEARGKAKGIFINVFIGIIFIAGSVLIIKTILVSLLDPSVETGYSSFF